MTLTACGAAPTGRSTMPISEVTPMSASRPTSASASSIDDPTLPNRQIDLSAEGAFATNK